MNPVLIWKIATERCWHRALLNTFAFNLENLTQILFNFEVMHPPKSHFECALYSSNTYYNLAIPMVDDSLIYENVSSWAENKIVRLLYNLMYSIFDSINQSGKTHWIPVHPATTLKGYLRCSLTISLPARTISIVKTQRMVHIFCQQP